MNSTTSAGAGVRSTEPLTFLKLDFDGPLPREFFFRLVHCSRLWRWPLAGVRYDRTRHGWHVIVGVEKALPSLAIVAAQAVLGSDPKREAFNLMRIQYPPCGFWRDRWNVLYESHARGVRVGA